jgi:hypothetical protein
VSLCLQEEELSRQQRKEAAEAQRAAERQAAQQKRDEEAMEKQQLLVALRATRKAKADELGQVRGIRGVWIERGAHNGRAGFRTCCVWWQATSSGLPLTC